MFIVDRSAPQRVRGKLLSRTPVVPRPQSCRSCQHYDAPAGGYGARSPEPGRVYPCLAPAGTPGDAQPSSQHFYPWRATVVRRYMGPAEGTSCPAYRRAAR